MIAGVALIALVAAALVVVRPWADQDGRAAEPTPTPTSEPAPVAVLAATASDAPAPTAEGIREAIDELVRDGELAGRVSAAVVDPATGERLYRKDADTAAVPASTTKLVTAATVLVTRGPAHQLATVAVAGTEPGEVVLVGGGDPTLAVDEDGFYPGAARLDRLAEQVEAALGETEITGVVVDSSLFTGPAHGPWDDDIPGSGYVGPVTALMTDGGRADPDPGQEQRPAERWPEPDLAAGRAFAELLGLDEDDVTRGEAAPAAAELGRVSSPPLQRLVDYMVATSDNVVAEVLARQVALARGEPATYAGAAAAMTATLADELGLAGSMGGITLADGSGLSRANQLTATLLSDLLAAAASSPPSDLAGVLTGLAVAGWSGTLADRYRDDGAAEPGAGVVRAKTGTLSGVHTLAGLVVTADGRLLVFALLANDAPVDPRDQLDRIAAALAGCGCR
jgi:D-alanyl-D-alanine carboxypeptidase/D-alanyl-D-alanine-endopeptidase (penicillin-binding protein 4)